MEKNIKKRNLRLKRRKRIRAKISGTSEIPRLSVYKSNRFVHAQLIDDVNHVTLFAHSTKTLKSKPEGDYSEGFTKVRESYQLGVELANICKDKKISNLKFDRGGFPFHGRVKALADGIKSQGITC